MNDRIQKQADRLLYDHSLLNLLNKYGTPHIIGSYRMNLMAWNDLDIDIDISQAGMSLHKLYTLTAELLSAFQPVWYEAKETTDIHGNPACFLGFETRILGELWNVDLWFFERGIIETALRFCDHIAEEVAANPEKGTAILAIKKYLMAHGLYAFDKYTSMDVYRAVIEDNISTPEDFLSGEKEKGRVAE